MVDERALCALAERQYGLVSRSQAQAGGLSSSALQRRVDSGRYVRVQAGVYRVGGAPESWHQRVLAACLASGADAVASHRTAARFWGLHDSEVIEVTVPRRKGPELRGAVVHRCLDLQHAHLTVRQAIPLTNPLLTLASLGAVVARPDVADALERGAVARLYTIATVESVLDQVATRGRPGSGVLRSVLDARALGRDRPDGLLEPRFACLLREQGLPPMQFQLHVRDDDGRFVARLDFALPEVRLAVEVDGYDTHARPEDREADYARELRLKALGWEVVRLTWRQVVRRPAWVARLLREVIARRT